MKYLTKIFLILFSLAIFADEEVVYEVGKEYESERYSTSVLFHYKSDVIRLVLSRDYYLGDRDFFLLSAIDTRDLYKIKKGEKIKLVERLRGGEIYKVELLKNKPRRPYYFIETENLKSYRLIETSSSSS